METSHGRGMSSMPRVCMMLLASILEPTCTEIYNILASESRIAGTSFGLVTSPYTLNIEAIQLPALPTHCEAVRVKIVVA